MILGSLFMFENTPDTVFPAAEFELQASLGVILPTVIMMGLFSIFVAYKIVRGQIMKGRTGQEGIVGEFGTAATDIAGTGRVMVQGIYWEATADAPIAQGVEVEVVSATGLRLKVKQLTETKES